MQLRVVADYQVSRGVIASRDFSTFRMADQYRLLAARVGHDFRASIALLERLPTFMEGPDHKRMRKQMALRNKANQAAQLAAVDTYLREFTARELRPGNALDLMHDFAMPLFDTLTGATTEAGELPGVPQEFVRQFPALFSSYTPLARRIAIDQTLAVLAEGANDAVFDDLALMVLGVVPLTGSLALTLHATFAGQPGIPLTEMRWPDRYTSSALRYVDRVCRRDTTVGDQAFTAGERVRCLIQSPDWADEENRGMTFGTGAHLCLGRQLSEEVWERVTRAFGSHHLMAQAGPLAMDAAGEPFARPGSAPLSFRAAEAARPAGKNA